jgi:hypothetical protein
MARWGGWRTRGAAIVAAMVLLASPAQSGCNPTDIFNAGKQLATGLSDCAAACADGVGCTAAMAVSGALTGVAAQAGQGTVNSFCSQAQGDIVKALSDLNSVGGIGKDLLGEIADALNAVSNPAEVVTCACGTEQGGDSLGSDLGDCVEDGLCALAGVFGDPCGCPAPPPRAVANCGAIDVKTCAKYGYGDKLSIWQHPECVAPGSIGATCPNPPCWDPYAAWDGTLLVLTTSSGTYVSTVPAWAEGECNPGQQSCFCPAPMKADWLEVPNPDSDDREYVFACDCPDGTHPGATKPNGISSCLCDGTNQPANFGFALFGGMCPPPACPAGQTRLGSDPNSPCVTPCSDPKQGMAFDGSCCDPAQMTTCGKCCPPTTVPDPNSGTCVPRPQPPK